MLGKMMVSALALTGVAYAPSASAQTAPAQEPAVATSAPASATNDRIVYEAAYFSRFNPQTAMDLVNNTPGFNLVFGDGRRGFSGSVSNVLIDGIRPTAKGEPIDAILQRIPVAQILRVEVLRGGEVSGDASGQSQVINIVRTPTTGGGTYELGIEYTGQNMARPTPNLTASYNARNGQIEWGVGVRILTTNRNLVGERRFYDDDGTFGGSATMENPRDLWDPYYSANIAFPLAGGRFSATGMINPDYYNAQGNLFDFFDETGAPAGALRSHWEEGGTLSELGFNYDRDIGPWALALVGLRTQHPFQFHERAVSTDALGGLEQLTIVDSNREPIETILRGTLSRSLNTQHRIEVGAESALNTLDSVFQLTIDDGGGPDVIPIPNSNVTVEEERSEFFVSHTWRPNDRWSVDSRLAWETSTLTFTGDANQSTELAFWKPSVQLSRSIWGNSQLRLRYYRDVGQLDFDDFVSSTSISDNLINGGNPDLQPQSDWRTELGGDFRFPGGVTLGLVLTHHDIEDVNDLVALTNNNGTPGDPSDDETFDAPGNIGEAEAWSLDVNLTTRIPFIPNSRLTLEGEFWDSEVTDPVTGDPRIISWQPESEVDIGFRQDFAEQHWSWGIEYYKQGEVQGYRLSEVDTQEEGPWVDLWWETTALPHNMKLRLWAANILDGEVHRTRRFFDPDRTGAFDRRIVDSRTFETGPWVTVELSGSF
jgi:hypothetical protein